MKLCRYNGDRVGVVDGDEVVDVTPISDALPDLRWPVPPGDLLIASLDGLRPEIEALAKSGERTALADAVLMSPVANPHKIMAAPVNYLLHRDEAEADAEISPGTPVKTIEDLGLFLKANGSLVGPGEGVVVDRPDRRIDHEVELAAVIGREGRNIAETHALDHVAGYAIGMDMSIRGTEDRSYRKSLDTFTVLGPWLVTTDEIADPGSLDLVLELNGEVRQSSNTSLLIYGVERLIAYASAAFTLYPGDILLTGTPEGVGPVRPGDVMVARIEGIGEMTMEVRG